MWFDCFWRVWSFLVFVFLAKKKFVLHTNAIVKNCFKKYAWLLGKNHFFHFLKAKVVIRLSECDMFDIFDFNYFCFCVKNEGILIASKTSLTSTGRMYLACAIYMYCVSTSFGIYVKTTILIVYSVTITYEYVRVQPFHFIHCNCSLRFMCLSTFFLFFLVFPGFSRRFSLLLLFHFINGNYFSSVFTFDWQQI